MKHLKSLIESDSSIQEIVNEARGFETQTKVKMMGKFRDKGTGVIDEIIYVIKLDKGGKIKAKQGDFFNNE